MTHPQGQSSVWVRVGTRPPAAEFGSCDLILDTWDLPSGGGARRPAYKRRGPSRAIALGPMWMALAPSEKIVLVNVGSSKVNPGREKHNEVYALLGAYHLSPQGAERLWTMPDEQTFWFENHFESCARRRVRSKSEDGNARLSNC